MAVAPPRKKGTLKAKIAEKEAAKALMKEGGDDSELEDVAALDPVEKKRLDRERELKADLSNAADLFGTVAIDRKTSVCLIELTVDPCPMCSFIYRPSVASQLRSSNKGGFPTTLLADYRRRVKAPRIQASLSLICRTSCQSISSATQGC